MDWSLSSSSGMIRVQLMMNRGPLTKSFTCPFSRSFQDYDVQAQKILSASLLQNPRPPQAQGKTPGIEKTGLSHDKKQSLGTFACAWPRSTLRSQVVGSKCLIASSDLCSATGKDSKHALCDLQLSEGLRSFCARSWQFAEPM